MNTMNPNPTLQQQPFSLRTSHQLMAISGVFALHALAAYGLITLTRVEPKSAVMPPMQVTLMQLHLPKMTQPHQPAKPVHTTSRPSNLAETVKPIKIPKQHLPPVATPVVASPSEPVQPIRRVDPALTEPAVTLRNEAIAATKQTVAAPAQVTPVKQSQPAAQQTQTHTLAEEQRDIAEKNTQVMPSAADQVQPAPVMQNQPAQDLDTPMTFSSSQASWRRPPQFSCGEGDEGPLTALLRFVVDPAGRPVSVSVVQSTGHVAIDRQLSHQARFARFNPFTLKGSPVTGIVNVPVQCE